MRDLVAHARVQRHWKRRGRGMRDKEKWQRRFNEVTYAFCRRSSPCTRESWRTLLAALGWGDDSPASCRLPEKGAREGLSGPWDCLHSQKKKNKQPGGHYMTHFFSNNTSTDTQASMLFLLFFWDKPSPHPLFCILSLLSFPGYCLTDCSLQLPYESADHAHHPAPPPSLNGLMRDVHDTMRERRRWVTLITDVTIRDGALCACAAAAILADGVEVVHLTHRHGDGCGRQADRDQGVGQSS